MKVDVELIFLVGPLIVLWGCIVHIVHTDEYGINERGHALRRINNTAARSAINAKATIRCGDYEFCVVV